MLRQDVEILAGLLESAPDPVRAQLAAEQVLAHTQEGQETLTSQREAVSWQLQRCAIGQLAQLNARTLKQRSNQAIYLLEEAGIQ